MASAGRILIMPKGNYDANTEYEMLDLVFHGGASWVAKKNAKGIEPSVANEEYWMLMCSGTDITTLEQRMASLEASFVNLANEEDVDLSEYAKQSALDALTVNMQNLALAVNGLSTEVDGVKSTVSGMASQSENFGKRNVLDHENAVTCYILPYTCPSAGEVLVYAKHTSSVSTSGYYKVKRNGILTSTLILHNIEDAATTFLVAAGDIISSGEGINIDDQHIIFTPYKYQ